MSKSSTSFARGSPMRLRRPSHGEMESGLLQQDYELLLTNTSNPSPKKHHRLRGQLRIWLDGWKFTLFLALVCCILVLLLNTGFLLWAVARKSLNEDRGVLYDGDCDRVRTMSIGLHLLINILSTGLLGASNYGMQCLSAPTRKDVDREHRQGNWLDIGVHSLRNLFYVSKRRSLMWICLALSSAPLHLVYNSTIFSTTSAYSYTVFAGRDSLTQKSLDEIHRSSSFNVLANAPFLRLYQTARNGSLARLDNSECVNAYATTWQTKYGSLLLVTDDVNTTNDYQYDLVASQGVFSTVAPIQIDPYGWLCGRDNYYTAPCSAKLPQIHSQVDKDNWTVSGYRIDSCLAEKLPPHCKLQYSLPLMITVIVANMVKAIILCYMSIGKDEPPLMTAGDAVASFLREPDRCSMGRCLLSGRGVKKLYAESRTVYSVNRPYLIPLAFENKRKRWFSAVSKRKWALALILWLIAVAICVHLLMWGEYSDGHEIWDARLGSVHAQALIKGEDWPTSLIFNTIIANTPQLIFSILYFAFNSIMTGMTLAAEWSRYALFRRGIRVSWNTQSAQRSSYFLSLPYRYAIPLMTASAILHWLISQSLFLVGVEVYDQRWARVTDDNFMTCGYTPVAVVSSLAVGAFMFLCLVALGCKRLASGMVVMGSCSLAIAAACYPKYDPNLVDEERHCLETEEGMELMPVKWGAVPVQGELGHCTFSAGEVDEPESGHLYQ